MNTLGQRLNILRKNMNLNQEELVNIFNARFNTIINRTMISKWENNKEYPRSDFIKYLSEFFNVSMDYLTCRSTYQNTFDEVAHNVQLQIQLQEAGIFPCNEVVRLPILGEIKAGYNYCANNELLGYEYVEKNFLSTKTDCFFLKIKGDSMSPMFLENDLVLIEPITDVPSGTIAAVLVEEEEGTLKRIIKSPDSLILQPLNHAYDSKVFTGKDLNTVKIIGKVIQSIRNF